MLALSFKTSPSCPTVQSVMYETSDSIAVSEAALISTQEGAGTKP